MKEEEDGAIAGAKGRRSKISVHSRTSDVVMRERAWQRRSQALKRILSAQRPSREVERSSTLHMTRSGRTATTRIYRIPLLKCGMLLYQGRD
jgi:hypothetical protein